MSCLVHNDVSRTRPLSMRGLRFYRIPDVAYDDSGDEESHRRAEEHVLARSRFRSTTNPERFALYSVHDRESSPSATVSRSLALPQSEHTLNVVREFRRVPLEASALALVIFIARSGGAAPVIATLAHFVERAVSLYQPAYLLLAHSLEQPNLSTLLIGVHERAALQAGSPIAFSVDPLMPEIHPLLAADPEWYGYCPELELATLPRRVSPRAV